MSWWKSCCSRASEGEWKSWFANPMVMVLVGIAAWLAMVGIIHLASTRGLSVVESACAWDGESGNYVARVIVRNRDPLYKLVTLKIQGRFRPPPGGQWPTRAMRSNLEAVSQRLDLLARPGAEASGQVEFALPGLRDFSCKVVVDITGHERFTEPPDPQLLRGIQ